MKAIKQGTEEIILNCNQEGIINRISNQKSGFNTLFDRGEFFLKHVDAESLSKALDFFTQLKSNKIIINYEINFYDDKSIETLILSGAHDGKNLIILVTSRQIDFLALDEIMAINNEQINIFRKAIKDEAEKDIAKENYEFKYFNEISRLNNELMNAQRELAKKMSN